jgi:hypothetical protein
MDYPYTNQCTSCHGATLLGTDEASSCYSCHDREWKEYLPAGGGIIIVTGAVWDANNRNRSDSDDDNDDDNDRDSRSDNDRNSDRDSRRDKDRNDDDDNDRDNDSERNKAKGELTVEGEGAASRSEVMLVNAVTDEVLDVTDAKRNGTFSFKVKLNNALPPCTVKVFSDGVASLTTTVRDEDGNVLENCEGEPVDLTQYPGGVHNVFHATAGNKVLVAWPSRYCQQGQPAYALKNEVNAERMEAIVNFLQTGEAADETAVPALENYTQDDDLYLVDAFGVAGSQGSSNFADEGYPQAGEVPFGCVWTARGVLLPGDDPRTADTTEATHMVWTKAERLTSGRRDPFRIEVHAVKDAGFVITWQEDPEGLRPGQGLGPGEGWSGAVAHSQTDVWYSFINWDYFDYVENADGDPINIVTHNLEDSGRPQVFVPMAMPMRLTNNAKCNTDGTDVTDPDLYCNFDGTDEVTGASVFGLKDQCADTVEIPTGPNNTQTPICVADINDDGAGDLPNIANTASTRPRTSLQGYTKPDGSRSAWVIVAAEESKGLGKFFFEPDGTPCEEGSSDTCSEEIGKNQWYFSFDMGTPDTSADLTETGLVKNLVNQGNMLNQPEIDWRTGAFYPEMSTNDLWGFDSAYEFTIFNTEIARRSSLLVQGIDKATASTNGLLALPSWKQGPMRQGGPADTMLRRIVDQGTSVNPYAFTNMVCNNWAYADGSNPYYPNGVCLDPATNLSGVVPDTCVNSQTGGLVNCPTVDDATGIGDTNPILQGVVQGEGNTTKVLTWHQCPSDGVVVDGADIEPVPCGTADWNGNVNADNLDDQSWYNPLDVSKGHRGFVDGDFVMYLYAWSPNWRLNAKGSDRYELYVRRSFDGGQTWTTTPTSFTASDNNSYSGDGTVTCETYRTSETGGGGIEEPRVCYSYAAGSNEQARNVTQHQAMRITTLDPRYAPTAATITDGCVDVEDPTIDTSVMTCDDLSSEYDSDLRNPSRYFMVFETGDNRTVQVGEAEPLDLFYSRAINFGDDYVVWADEFVDPSLEQCYPSDPHEDEVPAALVGSGFCNEFDRMNAGGDTHSSEANLEANPDGSKLYGVWAQWVFGADGEEVVESDAMARRIWWIDNYISTDNAWIFGQGTGDGVPANP